MGDPVKFEFRSLDHSYWLDGIRLPSITQVLRHTGFIDPRWYTEESRARGVAVHACCQFLIEGNLDWSTVHPDILPRVRGFEKFLGDYKPKLLLAEKPLYSAVHKFAGTPDLVLQMGGGIFVVDVKSGKSGLSACLQTAAQKILVEEHGIRPVIIRDALELPKEGGYKIVQHKDRGDTTMFLNALAMIHRRINEGELSI